MKMTKKIALAVVAALTFVFTGCDVSLSDAFQKKFGDDVFNYSDNDFEDGLGKWTIKGVNDTPEFQRGLQLLQTKHSDLAGLISIEGVDGGVVGLVFDVTQNKGKDEEGEKLANFDSYNFCVAGIRNTSAGGPAYYVSYYANIKEEDMNKDNFGTLISENPKKYRTFDEVQPDCLEPYEIEITKYTKLPLSADEAGTLTAVLWVTEIDNKTESEYAPGSYVIDVYDAEQALKGKSKNLALKDDAIKLSTSVVNASVIGKEGPKQEKVGVYANVYPKTEDSTGELNATVKLVNFTHAAIAE